MGSQVWSRKKGNRNEKVVIHLCLESIEFYINPSLLAVATTYSYANELYYLEGNVLLEFCNKYAMRFCELLYNDFTTIKGALGTPM